jgi:hypothetical protein
VHSFKLEAFTSGGQHLTQFRLPYVLVLNYTDQELRDLGIEDAHLNVASWDGSAWITIPPCTTCDPQTSDHRVVLAINQVREFVVMSDAHRVHLPLIVR